MASVAREVVLDLLPLYLAGEASPASRLLVEEYLHQDPELAERVRLLGAAGFVPAAPPEVPPDLELRALRRTRRLLALQQWLFGLGIAFVVIPLGLSFRFEAGRIEQFHFLVGEYPALLGPMLGLGVGCWISFVALRRRLRLQGGARRAARLRKS
jgi:hypothetical protein